MPFYIVKNKINVYNNKKRKMSKKGEKNVLWL